MSITDLKLRIKQNLYILHKWRRLLTAGGPFSLHRVLPQYLMYRPANTVPYATVETDLPGVFLKYCHMDTKGRLITRTSSEVEQKCCTFQHWIHQWTHGNLLVTNLQGEFHRLYKVNTNCSL